MSRLRAEAVTLAYGAEPVVQGLSLRVPDGRVTSIIGPNGCGKSTLLRSLARLLAPRHGAVYLDGHAIHQQPTKEVARRLGLLSQQPSAPDAITVEDLTRRGRYPHQALFQPPTREDRQAVERALDLAGVVELRDRAVDELSGGQRQRAWIAMTLAQDTPILLLDEPTTYLDIAHQQEVLTLVRRLNEQDGRTIVLVLHDVNDAARVSDHVVAMCDGALVAEGPPDAILTPTLLMTVFGIDCDVVRHPESDLPVCIPRSTAAPISSPPPADEAASLRADRLSAGYGERRVVESVTLDLPAGRISAIVGPNACGKSTLLRTLARLHTPTEGQVWLGDRPIDAGSHRDLARRLALLAQGAITPSGVVVEDLVAAGRLPYQRWYRQWSRADEQLVDRSLALTALEELRLRPADTLSGGQRQRSWIAMTLAQDTPLLLLDEPTTFLDIAHQIELLDLVRQLNQAEGRTIVMVLHDLGQACRYADYVIVMKAGAIVATGDPRTVMTEALVRGVFEVDGRVVDDPVTGTPLVLPPALGAEPVTRDAGPAPSERVIGTSRGRMSE